MPLIGVVIIGRNEGERLIRCLQSINQYVSSTIYVDSASTDNSLEAAEKLGVHSLALDLSTSFTAARARNIGFEELLKRYPETEFVQFIDGDCEELDNWIEIAVDFLRANSQVAVVSGVLNERFPEKSIYNTLCDLEWQMPIGEVKACGGNAMMRVSAFKAVNGFLPSLIAGEEPELCVRIRHAGWKIWHLNQLMMLHDADMTTFKQWWKRTIRAGFAFAEGAYLHGAAPYYHWVAESERARRWGLYIPLLAMMLFLIKPDMGTLLLLVYPLQWFRLVIKSELPFKTAGLQAGFFIIGKFAEVVGQFKFLWYRNKSKLVQHGFFIN